MEFYNKFHLGDCLFQLYYLRALDQYCIFYVIPSYIPELEFHNNGKIILKPLHEKTDKSIDTWIGNYLFDRLEGNSVYNSIDNKYDQIYMRWFDEMSAELGIANPFEWPIKHPELKKAPIKYDWLIINSNPLSGQWRGYDEKEMDQFIKELPGYKITTKPIEGIECTNTNILEIGKISIQSKRIIAINTGPIVPCLNKHNINKDFFVLTESTGYTFTNNVKKLSEITQWSN
tara:strand:+ start:187 stop:879 length:693 start_codon:yes stop_codon:yes gene_type:complete